MQIVHPSQGTGPSGERSAVLCPCVCSWGDVWGPGEAEVKWSPLPSNTQSLYISKSNRGRGKRGKPAMGDSGNDAHLETFHVCFQPRVLLGSLSFLTVSTAYVKRQRGIQHLTENSSQTCCRHLGDTNIGLGLPCFPGKLAWAQFLEFCPSQMVRLDESYTAA